MFDRKIITAAMAHAATDFPYESCGIVLEGEYFTLANTAEDPEHNFCLEPMAYALATRRGDIEAIIHSHPNGPAWPSEADQSEQMRHGIAWGIVPFSGQVPQEPFFWGGDTPMEPLLGRKFRPAVSDCYALCRDWITVNQGVTIPNLLRSDEWWDGDEDNRFLEGFAAIGFREVEGDPEPGDGLLMSLCSSTVNHCAMYVGNGLILHHRLNKFSREEPFHRWRKYVRMVIRRGES